MKQFPGRTLEELDGIDWWRFQRAREAARVQEIEEQRKLHIDKKLAPENVSPELWRAWELHNDLADDGTQEGDG